MSAIAPYNGPAPAPSRSLSMAGGAPVNETTVGEAISENTHIIDPGTLTPGIDPHTIRGTSAPPANPDLAAQLAEANARNGELIQALGQKDQDFQRQLAEMRFEIAAQIAAATPQNSGPSMPAGLDPDGQVTNGQLVQILHNLGTMTKATVSREVLGLTASEENAVLAKYPSLANVSEPRKTELIREAVLLMRSASADGKSPQANGSPANTRPAPVTRPTTGRMVPQTEAPANLATEEHQPQNAYQNAMQAYEAAGKIANPRERLAARKVAMKQAAASLGMTEEQLANASWKQR